MAPENENGTNRKSAVQDVWGHIREGLSEAKLFFREELWDMDLRALPRVKKFFVSLARIAGIVVRGVHRDRCGMQAGTLTYLTLLALVPVLALMFSVSKGLGAQDRLMETLGLAHAEDAQAFVVAPDSRLAEAPEQFGEIAVVVISAVERVNVRTLGSIGLVFLLWTVIRVVGKVEYAFNDIWGVRTPRSLARKLADYISILFVVPILVLLASSLYAFLSSDHALGFAQRYLGELSALYEYALRWTAGGAVVLAFMFLLMFMPNTRVRFFPALAGGVVTGACWLVVQSVYFLAQGGVTRYNAIYGTFAALPLFLVWLHTSWVIVLVGAEVAFAVQNHQTYQWEHRSRTATPATLAGLGLWVLYEAGRRFLKGEKPWAADEFCREHEIPVRLMGHTVRRLCDEDLLREVADEPGRYLPGRDLSTLTPADVERVFRGSVDPKIERLIRAGAPALDEALRTQRTRCEDNLSRETLRDWLVPS